MNKDNIQVAIVMLSYLIGGMLFFALKEKMEETALGRVLLSLGYFVSVVVPTAALIVACYFFFVTCGWLGRINFVSAVAISFFALADSCSSVRRAFRSGYFLYDDIAEIYALFPVAILAMIPMSAFLWCTGIIQPHFSQWVHDLEFAFEPVFSPATIKWKYEDGFSFDFSGEITTPIGRISVSKGAVISTTLTFIIVLAGLARWALKRATNRSKA